MVLENCTEHSFSTHFAIVLLQLLIRSLHRIDSDHCIPEIFSGHRRIFHIEVLLLQRIDLSFVHLFLLKGADGSFLNGRLGVKDRAKVEVEEKGMSAR